MSPPRTRRLALAGAFTAALVAAPTALADLTGRVTTPAGVPIEGASVRVSDASGSSRSDTTDATGSYSISTFSLGSLSGPLSVRVTDFDTCRPSSENELIGAPVPAADGAVVDLTLDMRTICTVRFPPRGLPDASAFVDPTTGIILSGPGGIAHVTTPLVPTQADQVTITLADGTPIGSGTRASTTISAPASYQGTLTAVWRSDEGATGAHPVAYLDARPNPGAQPAFGPFDLAAVVDLSGSMGGTDPENRRLDATHLLIELASPGDRLLGVGFDDIERPVFPRTTVRTLQDRRNLRATARQNIRNFGGTDYDTGLAAAYAQLTADPARPEVPKGAIFLTDGGHNDGAYENTHLRFARNGTDRSWPICVVQLGDSFNTLDEQRLRRIAADTGGRYLRAPTNIQLESLYFQCRGTSTGARTTLRRTNAFRVGTKRIYASRVAKRQLRATFFVSWGEGKYRLRLFQPGRKAPYTRSVGKRVRLVKGRTFQYFQVTAPRPGRWRLQVQRLGSGGVTERAITTINVQRRR